MKIIIVIIIVITTTTTTATAISTDAVEIGFGSLFLFFHILLPCIYQFVFIIELDCFN